MRISNAHKFYIAMAVVALCTTALLYQVIQLTQVSTAASAELKEIALVTQRHMESDMMHDAIRGDVLSGILATKAPEMVDASEVKADFDEHIANFKENAEANMKVEHLDPTVRAKFDVLMQQITSYGDAATTMLAMAMNKETITKENQDAFMTNFKTLETTMGDVSDSIGAWATSAEAGIAEHLGQASKIALGLSILSLLITLVLPVFVLFQIFRPQARVLTMFETTIMSAVGLFDTKANEVKNITDSLATKINDSSTNASNVSSTIKDTSQNADMVAAAAQEMNASLGGVSEQVGQARSAVNNTVAELDRVKGISTRLNNATHNVKEIIGLIDEVANKINLLSLNASIEAARAGDAGRGFAVVAQEVKSLATQTQSSSQEIIKQVNEITAVSEQVMGVITFFQESITSIQTNMERINTSVAEQGTATNQITKEITENASRASSILQASNLIVSSTQDAMEESGTMMAAADSVAHTAKNVSAELSRAIHLMQRAM